MSPAHVLEPTYDTIRRRLFAGVWPSGQRLEAARLAAELGVSMTPVRDSLNRLAGERLVHSSPGEGFQVPLLSETELRGLIDWHRALIGIALGRLRIPIEAGQGFRREFGHHSGLKPATVPM